MSFAATERSRLADTLLRVGPNAPTLCQGWETRDLAEHLCVRENNQLALMPGVGKVFADKISNRDYADLVKDWAAGPPLLLKPVDSMMNTAEHFVHHEDVLRGDGVARPREFSKAVNKELALLAGRFGKLLLRSAPVPVVLSPTTLPPMTVGDRRGVAEQGDAVVRVVGEPGELLLWVFGRDVVEVTVSGDPQHIAQSRE
ncbi:TIGR03085 family metal-binding protein [Corynebacterium sp.]|uniref:TIGR03085 family metal-binding protein n=1 Tax=Corynebacterium sp. TaxID=1720 RepID=UPI0037357FA2